MLKFLFSQIEKNMGFQFLKISFYGSAKFKRFCSIFYIPTASFLSNFKASVIWKTKSLMSIFLLCDHKISKSLVYSTQQVTHLPVNLSGCLTSLLNQFYINTT